jgi:hypothetical protein
MSLQLRLLALSAAAFSIGFSAETPSEMLNQELPRWIRLGFEHRFGMEGYTAVRFREQKTTVGF